MTEIKEIKTSKAPAAIGPYSQAVQAGEFIFLSGQIAIDPASGQLVSGSIKKQTRQVMENLKAVLAAVGADLSQVVKVEVFLQDMADFAAMNDIYGKYFATEPRPARQAVEVARLPKGALVEISAVAGHGTV